MKKILLILLLTISYSMLGQNTEQLPTQNSISLNVSDFPVNYYSGIPDINIPLMSIPTKNSNLNLDLTLNYDLYSNISSIYSTKQFGDAWRLNVFGKITRTYNSSKIFSTNIYMTDEMYYKDILNISSRTNPDLFSYEIFGLQGKFYFKRNGKTNMELVIVEQNDYAKIDFEYTYELIDGVSLKYKIPSFTITDKNGFKYVFSDYDSQKIGTADNFATDYHLSKIIDNYGTTLLEYEYAIVTSNLLNIRGWENYEKKPKNIIINDIGKIEFNFSPPNNEDQIVLKDFNNNIQKNIKLLYLIKSLTMGNQIWEKKLISKLEIWDKNNTKKQTYKFEYNEKTLSNPKLNNLGFLYRDDPCFGATERTYKENIYFDYYVLRKITYPTGGSKFLDFEINDYSLNIEDSNDNSPAYKIYKDNNSENFTFQDLPLVHQSSLHRYLLNTPDLTNSDGWVYINYTGNYYNPYPGLSDPSLTGGVVSSPLVFPKLKIYAIMPSASNTSNGSLQQTLTKQNTTCFLGYQFTAENRLLLEYDEGFLNKYTSITAKAKIYNTTNLKKYLFGNGLRIKRIRTFDKDIKLRDYLNGSYIDTPTQEITYSYHKFNNVNESSGDTKYPLTAGSAFYLKNYSDLIFYQNVSEKISGLGETQYYFDSYGFQSSQGTKSLPENSYVRKLPTRIVKKDENGNIVEENIFNRTFKEFNSSYNGINKQPIVTYEKVVNKNYVNGNTTPLELITESRFDTISRNLTSKKIINPILNETFEEQYTYVKYNDSYLPKTVNKFKNGIALNRSENFYVPMYCAQNNILKTYFNLSYTKIAKADLPLEIENEYTSYSCQGKVIEYKTKDGVFVSQIWGYNGAFVIAELHNIKYSEINQLLLASLISAINATGTSYNEATIRSLVNQLRTAHPNAKIKSYTFNPLVGMTSMTDVNGIDEFYEYDNFNRLYRIKDHNGLILKEYNYNYINQ